MFFTFEQAISYSRRWKGALARSYTGHLRSINAQQLLHNKIASGQFSKDEIEYIRGKVSYIDYCNFETTTMIDLNHMAYLLGAQRDHGFFLELHQLHVQGFQMSHHQRGCIT